MMTLMMRMMMMTRTMMIILIHKGCHCLPHDDYDDDAGLENEHPAKEEGDE